MRSTFSLIAAAILFLTGTTRARADVLTFSDGDKVQGTFVRRENGRIIFQSPRFGNLSVPENEATLEVTTPPTPAVVAPLPMEGAQPKTEDGIEALAWIRRRIIDQGIVRWWEPWQGRVAFSTDIVHDSKDRSTFITEARFRREWSKDETWIEPRYEYREEAGVTTVDLFRGLAYWRHDFSPRYFALYRPTLERDKVNARSFQPFPYTLLQQQVGAGVHLLKKKDWELRLGLAENFFNVWALDEDTTFSDRTESVFFEAELRLPWRFSISERGVWYYQIDTGDEGTENELEITKRLTEALSLGFRHEYRKNNPDARVTDFERLRFLLGYDF